MKTDELRLWVLVDRATRRVRRRDPKRLMDVRTARTEQINAAIRLQREAANLRERLEDMHLDNLRAARERIRRNALCGGCGKRMLDEFTSDGFEGVMNDGFTPFHHGCEDF